MNLPEKSHYIPRFILSNFTDQDGQLHCYAMRSRKRYQCTPEKAGRQGNLYRLGTENGDPYALEQAYAEAESVAAPIIREIVRTSALPENPKERDALALFVVDSAFRVPISKDKNEWMAEQVVLQELAKTFQDQASWQEFRRSQRSKGIDVPDADQEKYVKLVSDGGLKLKQGEGGIWEFLAVRAPQLALAELANFSWRLFTCTGKGNEFIVTSDSPVSVICLKPLEGGSIYSKSLEPYVVGHWRSATQISMAISTAHVLIANRSGTSRLETIAAKYELAYLNTAHCWYAETIFSSGEAPQFLLPRSPKISGIANFAKKAEQARLQTNLSVRVPGMSNSSE